MDKHQTISEIQKAAREISDCDISTLKNGLNEESISCLEASIPTIEVLRRVCKDLSTLPLAILDEETLTTLHAKAAAAKSAFYPISRAVLYPNERSNLFSDMTGLQSRLESPTFDIVRTTQSWILYLSMLRENTQTINTIQATRELISSAHEDLHRKRELLEESDAELKKRTENLISEISKTINECTDRTNAAVKAIEEKSAALEVKSFAEGFEAESRRQSKSARNWLIASILCMTSSISIVIASYFLIDAPKTYSAEYLNYIASKIFVVFSFVAASAWTSRLFKSAKNQASINAHKANSLNSFMSFIGATNDPDIKDAVLVETARSIYSAPGLLPSSTNDGETDNAFKTALEALKLATSAVKKG